MKLKGGADCYGGDESHPLPPLRERIKATRGLRWIEEESRPI